MTDTITKAQRQTIAFVMAGSSTVIAATALVTTSSLAATVALLLFATGVALYPWRGGGKHSRPRRSERSAAPPSRHDETIPLRAVRLLDPHTEITTELEIQENLRGG